MVFGRLFFLLSFSSCGMETFYYLDPPVSRDFIDEAASPSLDPAKQFVSFVTAPNTGSQDVFQGTAVYYRIFNSPDQLLSNKASIESINAEYSSQGMERLVSWGYQPLSASGLATANLVSAGGAKRVSIRLYNEDPDPSGRYAYPAEVLVDGRSVGVPLRSVEGKTFSFDADAEPDSADSVPAEGQADVSFAAGFGTSIWYVALYAVSAGTSPSLTPVYSQVVYLGSLAIEPASN